MELRKDYFLNRWVIISEGRSTRPQQFSQETSVNEGVCYFCPGNEQMTPPEIGRIEKNGNWIVRWVGNKFPAVDKKGFGMETDGFFSCGYAYGDHEIIIDTPDHHRQLYDLSNAELSVLLEAYSDRIFWLSKDAKVKYVLVFKNHGRKAGTSIIHSHTQVVSLSEVPPTVQQKVKAIKMFEACPYCSVLEIENKSERKCFENEHFVAFAPYASRFNYEIWVMPKQHIKGLLDLSPEENGSLAQILGKVLRCLKKLNADYNFYIHYSPVWENLHFHIEVTPRIATWAGFELSSGIIINSVSPEAAAKFYREN